MSDKDNSNSNSHVTRVSLVPFTSGLIPFVYAFFWPEGFGPLAGHDGARLPRRRWVLA